MKNVSTYQAEKTEFSVLNSTLILNPPLPTSFQSQHEGESRDVTGKSITGCCPVYMTQHKNHDLTAAVVVFTDLPKIKKAKILV